MFDCSVCVVDDGLVDVLVWVWVVVFEVFGVCLVCGDGECVFCECDLCVVVVFVVFECDEFLDCGFCWFVDCCEVLDVDCGLCCVCCVVSVFGWV